MAQQKPIATQEPSGGNKKADQLAGHFRDFVKQYSPPAVQASRDTLQGRYRIDTAAPLADFNTKTAQAYAVSDSVDDTKPLYALVCRPGSVQRHHIIEQLKFINHPHLLSLVAAGTVELSNLQEERFVLIYEQPPGKKLSALLTSLKIPLNEQFICKHIIAPIASAIDALEQAQITHGNINPDNIYYGETLVLGDMVSEPCGYSQIFYYEPIERIQAMPAGKGDGTSAQDYYALAILTLYIFYGEKYFAHFTPQSLLRIMLKEGVYNALLKQIEPSALFIDFFRGIFTQNSKDRWTYYYLKPWLDGKRYNVLQPPPPGDSTRPYEFAGEKTFTKRELAHLFFSHWDKVPEALQDKQFVHWLTVSVREKDLGEIFSRIGKAIKETSPKNEVQLFEQIMRAIILLDPHGPIRIGPLSFYMDGLHTLFAELFANNVEKELQLLIKFIEFNMSEFWVQEQQLLNPEYQASPTIELINQRLEKLRICIRNTNLGFGIERVLYELNPEMPCLSPLLAKSHVNNLAILLAKIDRLTTTLAPKEQDPIDRHTAAFIASKLNIQHEIRLHELTSIPAMANNRSFIALKILSAAQRKAGSLQLPGLAHWIALRILPSFELVNSQSLRTKLQELLLQHAQSGLLPAMADVFIESNYASTDQSGYKRARQIYHHNVATLTEYRQAHLIDQDSKQLGYMIAKAISYLVFFITVFIIIKRG